MKNNYTIILLIAFVVLFTACQKESKCDDSAKAVVSSNSPVVAGDTLRLSVSGIDHVALYKWSGPNGFSSKQQNPVIEDVMGYYAGVYTVDVITEEGCIYRTLSDSIEISGSQSGCDMAPNTVLFNRSIWENAYSSRSTMENNVYTMYVSSFSGDMTFEFRVRNGVLSSGIYSVKDISGDFVPGQVKIGAVSGSAVWYAATPGKVYVSVTDGKATVSYCDIKFISGTFGSATVSSSALITER